VSAQFQKTGIEFIIRWKDACPLSTYQSSLFERPFYFLFQLPLDTLYANFKVYPPAFRCIAPDYTWHTGIHVLMVQISS